MRRLGIILLSVVLTGCGVSKQLEPDVVYIEKRDTVIFRDTVLMVQLRDSVIYQKTDISEKSHLETDIATSDAWVSDGQLHHELRNKAELVPINTKIPNYISREEKYLTKTIVKEVEKDLKWYQQTLMYMGIVLLIIILIKLLWRRNLG